MRDFYNIAAYNKQLTPEEVKEAAAEDAKKYLSWAVCATIDHTWPGTRQDDGRDKIQTIALFHDPWMAENFIKNLAPSHSRDRLYIVRI